MAAYYTPGSDEKKEGQAIDAGAARGPTSEERKPSPRERRQLQEIVIEDPSHIDPSANATRTPKSAWTADKPPLPAPSASPVGNGHTPSSAQRAVPENAPPASRRQKCCASVCAEVKDFLGDWFGAEDMANAALGPFLCGCTDGGKSDDDDESELPMVKSPTSPSNRKALHEARQRFVNMPHIDILEAAFKMEDVHVERIKPFTEGQCHGGWKMLMQQCDNFFRYICSEGKTKALSLDQTKEFFQLVGHHFFNEDLSYLLAKGAVEPPTGSTREQLERDVCERFDLDGSHDLNFLEAFKCLRFCIEKKLKDEGHVQLRKVPSRSPEQSGYKRIKETSRGNQVSAYLADSQSAFLQDARSQGKVVVNMYRKKGKQNPHRVDELAEDLEFCTRLQSCDYVRRVYEIFQDNKFIYTVVDPMKGDLTQLRRKAARMDVPLTAFYFRTIFKQCLEGVNHIHEHGLIHGDLKELNVMLATKDISAPLIKIVDIGVGVTANQTNPSGTPGYRPPEVNETGVWYPKGDMFSLGVMFFQLLADRTPNMEKGKLGIFQKGAKLQTFQVDIANITRTRPVPIHLIEPEHSSTLKWLPSMMEKNRRMRPMSTQLLAYPWFTISDEDFEKAGRKLRQAGDTDDEGKSLLDNMESFGISAITSIVSSKVEGESQEEVMMESEIFPFFILAQTFVAALLWLITVFMEPPPGQEDKPWVEALGGLDRFFAGDTVLLLQENCKDYRWQVWRWLSYQFTHVGISHIGTNCLLNLLLGIPLEKLHGSLKAFIMYNVGVAGGALCYIVGDARNAVVGMSGGCYSLVGLHAAYTVINWAQRKYRKVVLMILFLIVAIDVSLSVGLLDYKGETKPSNSAHLGGATAGLVIGIILGNNLHVKKWEIVLKWAMVAIGIALVIFCLAWNVQWAPAPVQDTDFRYCWYRQVYNATLWDTGDKSYWRCVRCTDQACIDLWSKQEWIADATRDECSNDIGWYK